MPYLYTLYRRAAVYGEPMLRPPFYEFEDDPRAFDDCDDFLFGPHLLVAIVVEPGQRERAVYLPRGPGGGTTFTPASCIPKDTPLRCPRRSTGSPCWLRRAPSCR